MRKNTVRQILQAGSGTLCTRIFFPTPGVVELLGQVGLYDYVEFVAEYGTFDLHDLDNVCRAAELYDLGSMIKVDQSHQAFLSQRGVGAGFNAVLFTDCRSAADVRECVRLVRPDTPEDGGLYGAAIRRNAPMGTAGNQEYAQAIRDVVVCVMIEKRGALEELDEILEIPGLDMIQWGATDYSMNIGRVGERTHPEVLAAKKRVFETCISKGIPPRAELASAGEAQEYLDMGVRHFSIGVDVRYLLDRWRQDADALRAVLAPG